MTQDYLKQTEKQNELLKLNTKLWLAVKNNQTDKVRELIDSGANLHNITGSFLRRYDLEENTLIHLAAQLGFLDIVKTLIRFNTNINARNRQKQTPLHWAAYYGQIDVVKYLIEHGADINAVDSDGDPALTWAANKAQFEVFNYLISHGANPKQISSLGRTALHWVAISGETKMAEYLIKLGCDIKLKDSNNNAALDLAIENAHIDMVKLLSQKIDGN